MRLLFFQNCVSPHQMPYIEVLAQRHEVTVIVPIVNYPYREAQGWENWNTSTAVRLLVAPSDQEVLSLFESSGQERTVALFSGISAFKEVKRWFKMSLYYPLERGIISESPNTYRFPLWMHKIRFLLLDFRYIKYIKYVFAIGHDSVDYFRSWGSRWKVVNFQYTVALRDAVPAVSAQPDNKVHFCYIGSLEGRKNVLTLLKAFALFNHKHRDACRQCRLTVVGDGPEREKLEDYVESNRLSDYVSFAGSLPMDKAREVIASSHALVLPSLHDGWGVVVNEALMEGTMVYCSSGCGASALVDSPSKGRVFNPRDVKALAKLLWNDYGFFLDAPKAEHRRESLRSWALETLTPEALAEKMETTISSTRS